MYIILILVHVHNGILTSATESVDCAEISRVIYGKRRLESTYGKYLCAIKVMLLSTLVGKIGARRWR